MTKSSVLIRLLFVSALVTLLSISGLAPSAEARPQCPWDGVTRTTSGSTATGSTCDQALSNLSAQEWPKMNCPYGFLEWTFVHNNCSWNGSAWVVTGWFQYKCQTDCYNIDPL